MRSQRPAPDAPSFSAPFLKLPRKPPASSPRCRKPSAPPGAEAGRGRAHQRRFDRADRTLDAEFGGELHARRAAEDQSADQADGEARRRLPPSRRQNVSERDRRAGDRTGSLGDPQPGRRRSCPSLQSFRCCWAIEETTTVKLPIYPLKVPLRGGRFTRRLWLRQCANVAGMAASLKLPISPACRGTMSGRTERKSAPALAWTARLHLSRLTHPAAPAHSRPPARFSSSLRNRRRRAAPTAPRARPTAPRPGPRRTRAAVPSRRPARARPSTSRTVRATSGSTVMR